MRASAHSPRTNLSREREREREKRADEGTREGERQEGDSCAKKGPNAPSRMASLEKGFVKKEREEKEKKK